MSWLVEFSRAAQRTDKFLGLPEHHALLAVGLFGEAGSIVAELKKRRRERDAYPSNRRRLEEELGDFLWYFVRLADTTTPGFIAGLSDNGKEDVSPSPAVPKFLSFAAEVAVVVSTLQSRSPELRPALERVWRSLQLVATEVHVVLSDAAAQNVAKTESRWPVSRTYLPLFDEAHLDEERLPRKLLIEFRERGSGDRKIVTLRCNNLNFGDTLTDNINEPDGYAYHDVVHFAHAVHLGWSPVVRKLLRCKRKSDPRLDENEDGARAEIVEEAVSAVVFAHAKGLAFFDGVDGVEFGLLKTIRDFVRGYEVARVPMWQWETAIIEGFKIFRLLKTHHGGRVHLDLFARTLAYTAPTA